MSSPITVNIISDDETTPLQFQSKKQRTNFDSNPTTVFIIDDDPSPLKPSPSPCTTSTPSVVPETPSVVPETPSVVSETPMVESLKSYIPIVRCNNTVSDPQLRFSSSPNPEPSGLICLESDEECEGFGSFPETLKEPRSVILDVENNLGVPSACSKSITLQDSSCFPSIVEDDLPQVSNHSGEEDDILHPTSKTVGQKGKTKDNANKKRSAGELIRRTRNTKEEKARLMDEKKQQKEQEKLQKVALKQQAAEMKKLQKEIQSWEKGKLAQQSIMAQIDTKVVEQGSVGGQLLTNLAEKGITFQITSNPVERSIIWTMSVPENVAQALSRGMEISYVLLIFEAEEFCRLVTEESFLDHVSRVQSVYPSHTVCYLTYRLMAYINKREQEHYKNPGNHSGWRRPPVEKLLAKLTTHFVGVHSRLCMDEAELAEHVVGLTCSLASCQFRKKLTRLSINANGSLIPKDADRALIKKSTWLKALIAIPKVQPRFAIAIWKKYKTMKSLLCVYMDPSKSEHEKEFLLANLITEGLVGDNRRLGEVCSKRVYRILMAESGSIKTDDVENGADFFTRQSS
ncbi:crossover junction endonuclease EME1B-like [Cynara cardunculus var. scolymus]|uniref:crossover junction endonuclease EME1B-like n=1 Tax=Cynara cardunculus var. scolymus TaxID=59895 RepID=UPI000D62E694|nr:crossover junction endonuclease EME1B-like [Cynara cardunculus var. scolymus]